MKVMPWLRFPVKRTISAAMEPGNDVRVVETPVVLFELKHGPEKDLIFYECSACRFGAGCPCFSVECLEVPDEIIEHLRNHVEMCSGVIHTLISK